MIPIPTARNRAPGVTISPSGETIAYAVGEPREEVWIIDYAAKGKNEVER
jgi:hypothetical protein